jgi:pimeloyl-ACP methyl ester carboxylesterase
MSAILQECSVRYGATSAATSRSARIVPNNARMARMLVAGGAITVGFAALVFSGFVLPHTRTSGPHIGGAQSSVSPTPPPPTRSASVVATPPVAATTVSVALPVPVATTPHQDSVNAVGVTQINIIDTSRPTGERGDQPASPSRALAVTIRYPVDGPPSDSELPAGPVRAGVSPLVVFAHGFNTSAATYEALEHDLAAAGFIVAAPDFPLTSSALPGDPDESDLINQAADVTFVITTLLTPATTPPMLATHFAATKVGVVGHSDGGVTAAAAAYNTTVADTRIGAAAILSGAESDYPGDWFAPGSPPLLAIHGTADEINPFSASEKLYNDAPDPKYLVSVRGGSHIGPFTTDPILPAISNLIADFLAAELEHNSDAGARISQDATIDALSLTAD